MTTKRRGDGRKEEGKRNYLDTGYVARACTA
jgi:hypothetical protein